MREDQEGGLVDAMTVTALRVEMREAVREGIQSAMTADAAKAFWSVGFELAQEQAARRAGKFMLDGVLFTLKRLAWAAAAVGLLYALGGWNLIVTVWKSLAGKV